MAAGELRLPRRPGAVRAGGREEAVSGRAEVAAFSPAGGPAVAGRWVASGRVLVFALCPAAISGQEGIGSWSRRWEMGFVVTLLSLHRLKTRGGLGGPKRSYPHSAR